MSECNLKEFIKVATEIGNKALEEAINIATVRIKRAELEKLQTSNESSKSVVKLKAGGSDGNWFGRYSDQLDIARDVVVNTTTVLNSTNMDSKKTVVTDVENNAIKEVKAQLNTALRRSGATNVGKKAKQLNPALNLVSFTQGGQLKMQGSVALALRIAANDYFVNGYSELIRPKTLEDLGKMFKDVTQGHMEAFSKGGASTESVAAKIGGMTAKLLGIGVRKGASPAEYNALVTGLGELGIMLLAESGLIRSVHVEDVNDLAAGSRYNVSASIVGNGVFIAEGLGLRDVIAVREEQEQLQELIDIDVVNVLPRKEKADEDRFVRVNNQEFAEANPIQSEGVKIAEAIEYKLDVDAVEMLNEMYSPEELKALMGYIPIDENTVMSKTTRDSVEGRNRDIESKVAAIKLIHEEYSDQGFFYDLFIGRNLRTHIGNVVGNFQADKYLARWLIVPTSWEEDLPVQDVLEAKDTGLVDNFIYGLVQAFDGADGVADGEKNRRAKVAEDAIKLMNMPVEELKVLAKKAAHPGHAALAIVNLMKLKAAVANGDTTFKSTLSREVDGKTNGYAHKSMQFPLGEEEEFTAFMRATGIYSPEEEVLSDGSLPESLADLVAERLVADVYQMLGHGFSGNYVKALRKLQKSGVDVSKVQELLKGTDFELPTEATESANDVKGKFRNVVKGAATEVMYGSIAFNAGNKRAVEAAEQLMDKFSRGFAEEDRNLLLGVYEREIRRLGYSNKNGSNDGAIAKLSNLKSLLESTKLGKIKHDIVRTYNNSEENKAVYEAVLLLGQSVIGQPLTEAISKVFGKHQSLDASINAGMEFVFQVFSTAFDERKKEIGVELSKEQTAEIVGELIDIVPAMRTYGSEGDHDKVVLIDNGRTAVDADSVSTKTSAGKAEGGKDLYIQNLVTRMMNAKMNGPEASTLAVTTHSLDSGNMSEAVINHGKDVSMVMDAVIKGPGDTEFEKTFNEMFVKVNKEYSMMDAVVELVERAYNTAMSDADKYGNALDREYGIGRNVGNIDEFRTILLTYQDEIRKNRALIFSKDRVYGNMVSRNGGYSYKADVAIVEEQGIKDMLAAELGFTKNDDGIYCKG